MFARPALRCGILTLLIAIVSSAAALATGTAKPKPVAPPNVVAGKQLFERHCAFCHGIDGRGGRGPGLNRASLPHAPTDVALKTLIGNGIPPEMPASWFLTDEEIANLAAFVRSLSKISSEPLSGDPTGGAQLYSHGACARCHILAGVGTAYGPELTKITLQRSPSHIKEAIANPRSTLPEGFLMVQAVNASGEKFEGIRVNEDTFTLQIKTPTGLFVSLRKPELQRLEKLRDQTPMPAYEHIFSSTELDDLVAYLASQRGKE